MALNERLWPAILCSVDKTQEYSYTGRVKATVDIPDALFRQVKARSALGGRTIRDVTIEAYQRWLAETPAPYSTTDEALPTAGETWLAAWEALAAEIAEGAVDRRTPREILLADRR